MTALVIIMTGVLQVDPATGLYVWNAEAGRIATEGNLTGVELTSAAFASSFSWFPYVLAVAVILFAFSTLISWSYYGLKAWTYLFGEGRAREITFNVVYCLVVVVGALIHVISYIPFNLANAFDPIQNDLASGRIRSMEDLCERITEFTVEFFSFSFLDITHAYIQIDQTEVLGHKPENLVDKVLTEYQMLRNSQELDGITRAGEISLPDGNHHLYILPISFGNRWLGYMALLSRKRIKRFFQRFLMEYEDNFLDQQVMLMMHYSK